MTMKTMAAGLTLVTLVSLALAIGAVFGQEGPAVEPPTPAWKIPDWVLYQTQPGQAPRSAAVQPSGGIDSKWVRGWGHGARDEEAEKLFAADAQMQQKSQALLDQYTEAGDDEQKSKIKDQLAEMLEKQFSVQQQLREREVAKIEARVKKLRQTIDKRNEAKRSIIDKRLDQLIREAEGLGWNAPASGPVYPSGANFYQPAPSAANDPNDLNRVESVPPAKR